MTEVTIESFYETLNVLVDANPHARNKGDDFKAWIKDNFDCDGRISFIKEQRQITNRVSEQFRYFAPVVAFVCVPEVKRDTLIRYILERVYKQLEAVVIVGVSEGEDRKSQYDNETLIVFKRTNFTEWAEEYFSKINNAKELRDQYGISSEMSFVPEVDSAWYVGTTGNDDDGNWHDFSDEYIMQGLWENGWDDRFIDMVNSINVGDHIAIKSTFTQKYDLPFENHGKTVGAMRIKAIGIVTENKNDGKHISVDWTKLDPPKTWYGPGALRETIHLVSASDGYVKKQLLDFTFSNCEQDYSICEEYYSDAECPSDETDSNEELDGSVIIDENDRLTTGCNVLLYGVPGSGKSHTIEHELCRGVKKENRYRLVFHPEYMYSDFVGQILPKVIKSEQEGGKDEVTYRFVPGPFTEVLKAAYKHPTEEYVLIIEELNRGNAPAIFGEVFQLLDRMGQKKADKENLPVGTSEYFINNENIAEYVYDDKNHPIRIPSNLTLLATMNTSDQNVFTLDTAFQRRWQMRQIENSFERVENKLKEAPILDTSVEWQRFCIVMNENILINASEMSSTEDKRLGVYFVSLEDLVFDDFEYTKQEYLDLCKEDYDDLPESRRDRLDRISKALNQNRRFPEKVLKYLWDDAFKFNTDRVFRKGINSLEKVISGFMENRGDERFSVFNDGIVKELTGGSKGETA